MDIDDIKQLLEAVAESNVTEFILEDDTFKLVLRKGAPAAAAAPPVAAYVAPGAAMSPVTPTEMHAPAAGSATGTFDDERHVTVTSPMVGTFYRAPAPDADPYVKVGDDVVTGQPLCIIEAMKLMNEIESEVKGRIVKILVDNAEPVEYGQPLFVVEKE